MKPFLKLNPTVIIPKDLVIREERFYGTGEFAGSCYIGMNYWAAKEIGCPFPYPKATAVVTKDVAYTHGGWNYGYGIAEIFLHEQQESQFMQLGCNYPHAHMKTTQLCGPNFNMPTISHEQVLKLTGLTERQIRT